MNFIESTLDSAVNPIDTRDTVVVDKHRDLLVKLYELPPVEPVLQIVKARGVTIRRARAYEKGQVLAWLGRHFNHYWQSECDVSFSFQPVTTFLATKNGAIVGFCCYDATYRNFFGPVGVLEEHRRQKIGSALILSACHAMSDMGYAYAIMGRVDTFASVYHHVLGAVDIPDSVPSIYVDMLKEVR